MSFIPQPSSSRSAPSTLATRGHRRPDSEDPPFSQYRMPSSPPNAQGEAVFRTGNASLAALDALQPNPRIKTSRIPSAASSSSVPQRIDVKRLLAKPARPVGSSAYPASASTPSFVGTETISDTSSVLTSYTDGSGLAGSRYAPSVSAHSIRSQPAVATSSVPLAERPRKASLQSHASPSVPTPTKRRETLSSGVTTTTPTRPSGLPSPSSSSLPRPLPRRSSNNNISNRRPSELPKPTIRPASATTAASSPSSATTPGPPRPLKSPYRPVPAAAAAATNSTSHSLPASRSPSHTRSRPVITPSNPVVPPLAPPPPDLTPAGAVIHTYKEQERRRSVFENLARPSSSPSSSISQPSSNASASTGMLPPPRMPAASASSTSLPSPDGSGHTQSENGHSTLPRRHNRVLSFTSPFQNISKKSEEEVRESTAEPYFTVLGANSGRIVAVGGPADDDWSVTPSDRRHVRSITTTTVSVGRSSSAQAEKGVQRKLSGRLVRKSHTEDEEGRLRGRQGTTLQERRTASTPSAVNGRAALSVSTAHMNFAEQVWGGPSEDGQTPRSANMSARTPNDQPPSPGAGTKLWKLMKRLSTGGLKEKAAAMALNQEDAPPVPALPDDLRRKRMTFDVGPRSQTRPVGRNGEQVSPPMPSGPAKLVKSKSSAAGMRAVAAARNAEPSASGSAGPRTRRGTTTTGGTRSSSPMSSSEGGSGSGIFGQAASARSSTSSYGEEIQRPALPMPPGQIIPPSRLPALDVSGAGPRSLDGHAGPSHQQQPRWRANPMPRAVRPGEDDDDCPPPQSAIEPPALAPPPRRSTKSSTAHPSNSMPVAFRQQSLPTPAHSQSHGLPRQEFGLQGDSPTFTPERSPRARAPSTGAGVSPSRMPRPAVRIPPSGAGSTHSSPSAASSSAPSTPGSASRTPRSAATLRPPKDLGMIAPVNFGSGGSKDSPQPSPVRFRMLDSNAVKAAEKKTEQEKADMWDDLLNRSALAGGTLHLGSGEALLSDGMSTRGSTYSEYMR